MKNISQKIWWLIAGYLALGYIFTPLYRLRFLLVVMAVVFVLTLLSIESKLRWYGLIAFMVLILFFFKIVPSPYLFFKGHGLAMSISVALTVLIIYLSVLIPELVYHYFSQEKTKSYPHLAKEK